MRPSQIKGFGFLVLLDLLVFATSLHAGDQTLTVERLIELDAQNALTTAGIKMPARQTASSAQVPASDMPTVTPGASASPPSKLRIRATWGITGNKWAEIEMFPQSRTVKVGDTIAEWRVCEIADGCVQLSRHAHSPTTKDHKPATMRKCVMSQAPSNDSMQETQIAGDIANAPPLPALPSFMAPPLPASTPASHSVRQPATDTKPTPSR